VIKKSLHILGVLLAIGSVVWIITGSTVVFHQKYVYHNLLTAWQDMILKTSSKDSKKYFKFIEKNPFSGDISAFLTNGSADSDIFSFNSFLKKISSGYFCYAEIPEYIKNNPHRGPPAI
jgi:hypothetical protein